LRVQDADACDVASRSIQTCDEACFDWVYPAREYDGNSRGGRHGCTSGFGSASACGNDRDAAGDEVRSKRGEAFDGAECPTVLNRQVPTFNETDLLEALTQRLGVRRPDLRRAGVQKTGHSWLRPHCLRPSERGAKQSDEFAPSHSITLSAMASTPGGMVRPSACAVLRLTTSSNFVDCRTGRSPAFSPLRIRPT